jgi:putative flippase GtrA
MQDIFAKLSRYAVTGGAAAVVDAAGFAVLQKLGMLVPIAASLSFCAAALLNYTLTAPFVFGEKLTARGFKRFFIASLGGLAINVGVTVGALAIVSSPLLAKLAGIAIAFFANFAINLFIVFRQGSAPSLRGVWLRASPNPPYSR